MARIKKQVTTKNTHSNFYCNLSISASTLLILLLCTAFGSVLHEAQAQTPMRVFVNTEGDTVFITNKTAEVFNNPDSLKKSSATSSRSPIISGKNTLARFNGAFHGVGRHFLFILSDAFAASKDGAVVIGTSATADGIEQAFRWDAFQVESLGTLPGGDESVGVDVSADGSVVVGYGFLPNGLFEAFRWIEDKDMEGLGYLHSGEAWSEALAVSADGSVVVGSSSSVQGLSEAFRWTEAGGMESLGDLPGGGFSSRAFAVSADGSIIVGEGASKKGDEAFIWTKQEGMQPLLTGGRYDYTSARAISDDGSVVVGLATTNNRTFTEAFLLNRDETDFEGLGHLPGGQFFSRALDVSPDGSIVVGHSQTGVEAGGEFVAFIWTNSHHHMRSLKKVLEDAYGLDLTGWTLKSAKSISVSDRGIITIVGSGINPEGIREGWRAALPVFPGVGDLPGELFFSSVQAISADGSVVVGTGTSSQANGEAFRWENGSIKGLGGLGENIETDATAVSADGSVVVGQSISASGIGFEAFRWTEDSGMVGLGDLPGGHDWPFSEAHAVSANGAVIVGRGESEEGFEAFRWEDGEIIGLADFPGGGFNSEANGVSKDGSVVVGRSLREEGFEAFRWTAGGGMQGLGDLPGGNFSSVAYGVSADGTVVVGGSRSEEGFEAFRWTEDDGMVGLGDLPGDDFSSVANAVSADGSIVVGKSETDEGFPFGTEAFVWTQENGMQNLKELALEQHGSVITGWVFGEATGVSVTGDIVMVTGIGMNPLGLREGFRVPLTGIGSTTILTPHKATENVLIPPRQHLR